MRSRILLAWLDTRRRMRASEAALARHRNRLWTRLQPTLARTPALAGLAGRELADVPVVTPAEIRANYGRWNSLDLTDAALREAATRAETGGSGEVAPGVVAGFSTGTSGQRGLFVASAAERAFYIGQSLARLLPASRLLAGARVALFLRANSALYGDVAKGGRFRFGYFPLDLADKAAALSAFAPDVLIAPSHILAELADIWRPEGLRQCFYGAEPMGEGERQWIAAALGVRPDPIYQATEGFLAAACRHGRLHLNEDSLDIDLQPVPGTQTFRPVVTDLRRTSQPIVRVLLDDLVEPEGTLCPCGFAGRIISPVMGRFGDLWRFGDRIFTPREATEATEAALGPSIPWQATASPDRIRLALPPGVVPGPLPFPVPVETVPLPPPDGPKRHRVRWHG
jgi:putative adenylate-forming enzyme